MPEQPTGVQLETLSALKRHGKITVRELAEYLDVNQKTLERRLQLLRVDGWAKTNGKRGPQSRWQPDYPTDHQVTQPLISLSVHVHSFLRTTPGVYTPTQIAGMTGLDVEDVRAALSELSSRSIVRSIGSSYDLTPDHRVELESIDAMVDTWKKGLSIAAQQAVSVYDTNRLKASIREMLNFSPD